MRESGNYRNCKLFSVEYYYIEDEDIYCTSQRTIFSEYIGEGGKLFFDQKTMKHCLLKVHHVFL